MGVTPSRGASWRRLTASIPASSAMRIASSTTRTVVSARPGLTRSAIRTKYTPYTTIRRISASKGGPMSRRQIIGAGWIGAAAISVVITLVFRTDSGQGGQVVGTIALAAFGGIVGLLLLVRLVEPAVWLSVAGGLVWFVVYAWLVLVQAGEVEAWVTDAFLALLGAVLAVGSWTARGQVGAEGAWGARTCAGG